MNDSDVHEERYLSDGVDMRWKVLVWLIVFITACVIQIEIDAPVDIDVETPEILCDGDSGVPSNILGDAGIIDCP